MSLKACWTSNTGRKQKQEKEEASQKALKFPSPVAPLSFKKGKIQKSLIIGRIWADEFSIRQTKTWRLCNLWRIKLKPLNYFLTNIDWGLDHFALDGIALAGIDKQTEQVVVHCKGLQWFWLIVSCLIEQMKVFSESEDN